MIFMPQIFTSKANENVLYKWNKLEYVTDTNQCKLAFSVGWPHDNVLPYSGDGTYEDKELEETHLSDTPVVEYGLSPVWQAILQDQVISAYRAYTV